MTPWGPACPIGSVGSRLFTLEFELDTLHAVLDELALAHLTLLGISCGGCIAVRFGSGTGRSSAETISK
jgi:hypothetical protein